MPLKKFRDAQLYLKQFCYEKLTPKPIEKQQHRFICPYCSSGANGTNNDAGFRIVKSNPIHFKCDVCNAYGDIFQLAQDLMHLPTRSDAIQYIQNLYSFTIDKRTFPKNEAAEHRINLFFNSTDAPTEQATETPTDDLKEKGKSISQSINKMWHDDLMQNEKLLHHLYGRGLNDWVIEKFYIGYNIQKQCYVLPFPKSDYAMEYYPNENGNQYICMQGIANEIFNIDALNQNDVVFICEGIFDALSIQQCGFNAIALCGCNIEGIAKAIIQSKTTNPIILFLDNDTEANGYRGQTNQKKLYDILRQHNVLVSQCNAHAYLSKAMGIYLKDANDCLVANPKRFCGLLKYNVQSIFKMQHRKTMAEYRAKQRQMEKESQ